MSETKGNNDDAAIIEQQIQAEEQRLSTLDHGQLVRNVAELNVYMAHAYDNIIKMARGFVALTEASGNMQQEIEVTKVAALLNTQKGQA